MTSTLNQPNPTIRSQKRFLVVLAVGLGLVALAAGFLVLQLSRDDGPKFEADFAEASCEDFDVAENAELSALSVESSNAAVRSDPDIDGGNLYCNYIAGSGLTLTITVASMSDEDGPAEYVEQARGLADMASGLGKEEFHDDHTGFTVVYARNGMQRFNLFSAAGHLSIAVRLEARPPEFEPAEGVGLVETLATRALERFESYV